MPLKLVTLTYIMPEVEHKLILILLIFQINVQRDFLVLKVNTFISEFLDEVLINIFLFLLLIFLINNVKMEKKLFRHVNNNVYHLVLQIEFFKQASSASNPL